MQFLAGFITEDFIGSQVCCSFGYCGKSMLHDVLRSEWMMRENFHFCVCVDF